MDVTAKKILSDLKKGKFEPVYILQGEETYYIDLISDYIEHNVLSESERSFNQTVVYGKEAPVHAILNAAKRFPMMAERQVVVVKEAQSIPDLQKETGTKMMLDYLAHPLPSTILVLCHKHKTLDKRKTLGKKADKLAVVATFKRPYDNQVPAFVSEYVASKGFEIDDSGVQVFSEYVGNDLKRLTNEIDKVLGDEQPGSKLSAEKVMRMVGVSKEYNIFELQKALISRDKRRSLQLVNYFSANTRKNPLIPMVAYLYSFFSKLLIASSSSLRNERDLISLLKISPLAARDYSVALSNYSTQEILKGISYIKTADLKLKGVEAGSVSDGDILRELVFQLI